MLCNVCEGSGNILVMKPVLQWWDCPACGGAGVREQHGAPVVNAKHRRRTNP
jgi:DnaJ-class molecular chaperone